MRGLSDYIVDRVPRTCPYCGCLCKDPEREKCRYCGGPLEA